MKDTYFRKLSNPLGVATLDMIADYSGEGWIITRIFVPLAHRGKMIASDLLNECLIDADAEQQIVYLEIEASDGLSADALEAWYSRYGFEESNVVYKRLPNNRKDIFE